MFNLDQLIQMVKKGEFPDKPFNIRKKADWKSEQEELDDRLDAEEEGQTIDPDAQNQSQVDTLQTSPEQIAKDQQIQVDMDLWLQQNFENMKVESQEGSKALTFKMLNAPEKSSLDADKSRVGLLVEEIRKNPQLMSYLSNKIDTALNIGVEMSSIFVGTMLAKYKSQEERVDKAPVEDPVGTVRPVEEVARLDDLLYKKMLDNIKSQYTGDIESRIIAFFRDIGIKKYIARPSQALQAGVSYSFGSPERDLDQRLNFFLNHSHHLEPFFSAGSSLSQNFNLAKSKNEKIAVLDEFNKSSGLALFKKLKNLIDNDDEDILSWAARGIISASYKDAEGGELTDSQYQTEGRGISIVDENAIQTSEIAQGFEGEKEQKIRNEELNKKLMGSVSTVSQEYIKEDIKEMIDINWLTSESTMFSYFNQIENPEVPLSDSQRNNIIRDYSQIEKLNSYFKTSLDRISEAFLEDKMLLKPGMREIVCQDKNGKSLIPSNILNVLFNKGNKISPKLMDEKMLQYKDYIKKYKEKVDQGLVEPLFTPNWRSIISDNVVADSLADLGEIKSKIFALLDTSPNMAIDKNSIRGIIQNIPDGRDVNLLNKISNVSKNDSPEAANEKKYSFIYMTYQQWLKNKSIKSKNKKYSVDINRMMTCYEGRKKYQERKAKVDTIIDEKKKKEKLQEIYKQYRVDVKMRNLKAEFGTAIIPLLPTLDTYSSHFSDEARSNFIDLFDHHKSKISNFIGTGNDVNAKDAQGRTNTELYYRVRGEAPPEHVKQMIDFYNNDKYKKQPWRNKIIQLYEIWDQDNRSVFKMSKERIGDKKKLKEIIEKSNYKIINTYYKGNNNNKVLRRIQDPSERMEFQQYMEGQGGWDKESHLPLDYYQYFDAQKDTKRLIENSTRKIEKKEELLRKKTLKINLDEELINKKFQKYNIEDINFTSLRHIYSYYQRMGNRLLKLSMIKKYGYKFASVDILLIDESMKEIQEEFNKLFDRLLR